MKTATLAADSGYARGLWAAPLMLAAFAAPARALEVDWKIYKPSNTGVPGERVFFAEFGPEGRLWVSAIWPFWGQGGVGIYDTAGKTWTNYANWETPLPSPVVNDVAFGPEGVVWFATSNGLARKNADSWTVYNTANSPLVHNNIRDIDLDSDGHVWINNSSTQTTAAAILEFDGANWRSFSVPGELPWPMPFRELSAVMVDSDDHVWVGNSFASGVAEFDGQSWALRGEEIGQVHEIVQDMEGDIWLAANFLNKFDGTDFVAHSVVGPPTALAVGDDGRVWVGSFSNVIYTPNGGEEWFLYTQAPIAISSIAPQPGSGDVWITSIGAVRHHGPDGQWMEAFNSYNSGVPDYFLDGISTDRNGNIWFASGEAGVTRFDGAHWQNWGSHNPNIVWPSLAEGAYGAADDSAGNIWIGTLGILRWDGEVLDYWPIGLAFRFFAEDLAGTLWAAGGASLYTFEDGNWILDSITDVIEGMEADSQGNLWVGGWYTVQRWDGEDWTVWDPDNSPLWDYEGVNALAVAPDDTVWLGTNRGLVHFDGADWTLYDTGNSPLPAAEVQGVAVRPDGVIGLSCHEFGPITPFPNGVVVIDGDINEAANWSVFTYETTPLPHYQLGGAEFDDDGNLWVSTISEGVAKLILSTSLSGDADGDGDVDLVDVQTYFDCVSGPGTVHSIGCGVFDFDGDQDVDWADAAAMQRAFSGE